MAQTATSYVPDLAAANLQGAALAGANLSYVKAYQVNFAFSDLTSARAIHANFDGANLTHAVLQNADLSFAHLHRADLSSANLRNANLVGADLRNVKLDGRPDFEGARLDCSVWSNVDLTQFPYLAQHANRFFGDASVTLPDGVQAPDHWPKEVLGYDKLKAAWRAWQLSIGFDPKNPE